MADTRNPWPEESDYGKLWRKGYRAGQADTTSRLLPSFLRLFERKEQPQ